MPQQYPLTHMPQQQMPAQHMMPPQQQQQQQLPPQIPFVVSFSFLLFEGIPYHFCSFPFFLPIFSLPFFPCHFCSLKKIFFRNSIIFNVYQMHFQIRQIVALQQQQQAQQAQQAQQVQPQQMQQQQQVSILFSLNKMFKFL